MMKRTPEPELMDAPEQARAYAEADFSEPNRLFVNLFRELVENTEAGQLIDLGCGPGDICIRLARVLPDWRLVGLDAGPNMLSLAQTAVKNAELQSRIDLVLARLPDELPGKRFDAVISNSLLHHLPEPMVLWESVRTLAGPGCLVQVMDLHRPDTPKEVDAIVDAHAADAPEVLRNDFRNSLHAAYTCSEIQAQIDDAGLSGLTLSRPSDRHWMLQGKLG